MPLVQIRFTALERVDATRFAGKGVVELSEISSQFVTGQAVTFLGVINTPCAPPVTYAVDDQFVALDKQESLFGSKDLDPTECVAHPGSQRTLFSPAAPPKLLGLDLYTNRWGVLALQWEIYAHYLTPGMPALPDLIEQHYPGLRAAIHRGIRELASKNVAAGSIVYLNNQVQIWPAAHLTGAMPSDFYPVQATDGYEAVIEKLRAEQEASAPRLFRSHLELALHESPELALTTIRAHALASGNRMEGGAQCLPADVLVAIQTLVTPWAMASERNNYLAYRILGGVDHVASGSSIVVVAQPDVLWVLGAGYRYYGA